MEIKDKGIRELMDKSEWYTCPFCGKEFEDENDIVIIHAAQNRAVTIESVHHHSGIQGITPYHKKCFIKNFT